MENLEAVKEAFSALNSFKRSRTLAEKAGTHGYTSDASYHELKKFKEIDRIELALRVINKNERDAMDNNSNRNSRNITGIHSKAQAEPSSKTEGGEGSD